MGARSVVGGEMGLIQAAIRVRMNAYAPYSRLFVGAAVLSELDRIYAGCNVENANYTATTHAEQSAIVAMRSAEGVGARIRGIAIVAAPSRIIIPTISRVLIDNVENIDDALAPCGHCRQIIWEFVQGNGDVPIYGIGPDSVYEDEELTVTLTTIGNVFPAPFGPLDLGIGQEE